MNIFLSNATITQILKILTNFYEISYPSVYFKFPLLPQQQIFEQTSSLRFFQNWRNPRINKKKKRRSIPRTIKLSIIKNQITVRKITRIPFRRILLDRRRINISCLAEMKTRQSLLLSLKDNNSGVSPESLCLLFRRLIVEKSKSGLRDELYFRSRRHSIYTPEDRLTRYNARYN